MAKPMPMFPLGTVLFPHAALPLHLFEDRYRALAETCLRGDGRFGVVLIERGFEVGGGDQRFGVGTVAHIVEAARTPDGRYLLATVGAERFRVKKWLDDDPFPRAEIDVLGEPKRVASDAGARRDDVQRLLGRVLAMSAELGDRAAPVDTHQILMRMLNNLEHGPLAHDPRVVARLVDLHVRIPGLREAERIALLQRARASQARYN